MLDMSLAEMAVIVVVAVVFIGPKELPHVIRAVAKGVGHLKNLSYELREAFGDLAKESGLKDVQQELDREMRKITGDDGKEYEAYDISDLTTPQAPKRLPPESDHE